MYFKKVPVCIILLSATVAMITLNINQVHADTLFIAGSNGVVVCPESNDSFDIDDFVISVEENGGFSIASEELPIQGNDEEPNLKVLGSNDKKTVLAKENIHFVLKTVMTLDNLCGSEVPSEITIRGYCGVDEKVTFKAKNGLEAEGFVEFRVDGDIASPSCVPQWPVLWRKTGPWWYKKVHSTGKFPHKYSIQNYESASDLIDYEKIKGQPGKMLIVLAKVTDEDSLAFIYSESKRAFYKSLSNSSQIVKSISILA